MTDKIENISQNKTKNNPKFYLNKSYFVCVAWEAVRQFIVKIIELDIGNILSNFIE